MHFKFIFPGEKALTGETRSGDMMIAQMPIGLIVFFNTIFKNVCLFGGFFLINLVIL